MNTDASLRTVGYRKILWIVKDLLNYGRTVCILEYEAVIYSPYLQYIF